MGSSRLILRKLLYAVMLVDTSVETINSNKPFI